MRAALVALTVVTLAACGDRHTTGDALPGDAGTDTGSTLMDGGDAGSTDAGGSDAGATDGGDAGPTDAGGGDAGPFYGPCIQDCMLAHTMCGNTSDCEMQCTHPTIPPECTTEAVALAECFLHASDIRCAGTQLAADSCNDEGSAAVACVSMHADGGPPTP